MKIKGTFRVRKPPKKKFKKLTRKQKEYLRLNQLSPDNNLGLGFYSTSELLGTSSLGTSNRLLRAQVDSSGNLED